MPLIDAPYSLRPLPPWRVNWDSEQAKGLTAWWPMGPYGGTHTSDLKTRQYNVLPTLHLLDHASDTDDNFRAFPTLDKDLRWAERLGGGSTFSQLNADPATAMSKWITATAGTMAFWFRPISNGNSHASVYALRHVVGDVGGSGGYFAVTWGDWTGGGGGQRLHFWVFDGAYLQAESAVLTLDQLYHVAPRWDGSAIKLYIDGIEVASTASAGPDSVATNLKIGEYTNSAPDCYLADLRFYNRAIDPKVIYQIWHPATRHELYKKRKIWVAGSAAAGAFAKIVGEPFRLAGHGGLA